LMDDEQNQGELNDEELPEIDPWPASEMLAYEKDLLGFYISGHPLEEFEWEIETFSTGHFEELDKLAEGDEFRLGGLITDWRKFFTKSGNEMATFTLEGLNGHIPVVLFKETVQQFAAGLHNELPVMVAGEFSLRDEAPQMIAQEVVVLGQVPGWYAEKATVHLTEAQVEGEKLRALREKLVAHRGGTPLHFCVSFPAGERVFLDSAAEFKIHPSHNFKRAVEDLFGEDTVFVKPLSKICKLPPRKRSFGGPPADLGYN
ncbi:MAG: OB-fold nucleic acid binding domain-containing protein, partial [Kiritimatiellia bacterium]